MNDETELLDMVVTPGHLRFCSTKTLVEAVLWAHRFKGLLDPDAARAELFRREFEVDE